MRPGSGLWIPAFAGMTHKRQCRHSREGGNPWLSDNRTGALHLTPQREVPLVSRPAAARAA